jgi:hypothetical protein
MSSMFDDLAFKKISVTVNFMGQLKTLKGTLLSYSKPFIQMEINKQRRYINENTVKEIFPIEVEQPAKELR